MPRLPATLNPDHFKADPSPSGRSSVLGVSMPAPPRPPSLSDSGGLGRFALRQSRFAGAVQLRQSALRRRAMDLLAAQEALEPESGGRILGAARRAAEGRRAAHAEGLHAAEVEAEMQAETEAAEQARLAAETAEEDALLEDLGAERIREEDNIAGLDRLPMAEGDKLHRGKGGQLWRVPAETRAMAAERIERMKEQVEEQRKRQQERNDEDDMLSVFAPGARRVPPGRVFRPEQMPEGMVALWSVDGEQIVMPQEEARRIMEIRLKRTFGDDPAQAPYAQSPLGQARVDAATQARERLGALAVSDPEKYAEAGGDAAMQSVETEERDRLAAGLKPELREQAQAAWQLFDQADPATQANIRPRVAEGVADLASLDRAVRVRAAASLDGLRRDLRLEQVREQVGDAIDPAVVVDIEERAAAMDERRRPAVQGELALLVEQLAQGDEATRRQAAIELDEMRRAMKGSAEWINPRKEVSR
jgi:hypothetical protein